MGNVNAYNLRVKSDVVSLNTVQHRKKYKIISRP